MKPRRRWHMNTVNTKQKFEENIMNKSEILEIIINTTDEFVEQYGFNPEATYYMYQLADEIKDNLSEALQKEDKENDEIKAGLND